MRRNWRAILGFAITAFLLWWVLKEVSLSELWAEIQAANFWLLGLAVAIGYSNYFFRSMRWGILLRPICSGTSFRSRFEAMNIGFMATNLIPGRVGEFVRPYALSRMEAVSVSAAFGSIVVERFLDILTIAALLFVAIAAPEFPENPVVWDLSLGVWVRGILSLLGALLLLMVLLLVFPRPLVRVAERVAHFLPEKAALLVVDVLEAFLDGLRVFQSPALLVKAAVWSVAIWLCQSLSFWVAFLAFGIHVGFDVALFVNAAVALAVAVPAAPGFIGTFQLGVTTGLGVYGVPEAAATALSFGFHLGGFIPVTLIGLFYAWRLGLSFGEVGKSEIRVEGAVEEAHPELTRSPRRAGAAD
ncbi:MAG: lysylphosphatidylglycerol synthase transmembrane domain-containing protein [Gemmatimonadota bacterium]